MEIDSIDLGGSMEGNKDLYAEQSIFPCASDMGDIFGDPQVLPRVGDEYQAKIPPLIAECDCLQLINVPTNPWLNSDVTVQTQDSFLLGLPIPLMWSNIEVENINGTVEFENGEESQIRCTNDCAELKVEAVDTVSGNGKGIVVHSDLKQELRGYKMELNLAVAPESETKMNQLDRGFSPLPGSLDGTWTDIESDSFLLGLYIFGKNLIFVKSFVESKEMGEILSFYYGKFYHSDGYRRWSESRKLKSRRSIHGQKIFTGWRQQELLSRLSSQVSQERQTKLLEVSRAFGEGKISFEEFVFTLRNAVGINMLIEAIGIGKGKQDLTGIAMEPVKPNYAMPVRPEIPIGKACSSLTSAEIIKFLTGDFRSSKARSSDLFWEAVWPRLLARGWHSEQPKDHCISANKNSLVFLVPAVKKFSRRRLVKGKHYFDSVSDVLNKVASEPGLLELEIEGGQHKKEYEWNPSLNEDRDDLPNKKQHHYLQPRNNLNSNRYVQKFTIVDTSLAHGAERPKVRELRSLPLETTSVSTFSSLSSESGTGTSEESQDEAEETHTSNPQECAADRKAVADPSDCVSSILNINVPDDLGPTIPAPENHENQSANIVGDKQQEKTMKYQFSRKVKSGCSRYLAPIKQWDFIASDHEKSSCSTKIMPVERKVIEDESHCPSNLPDECEDMDFQVEQTLNFSLARSLAKGHSEGSSEGIAGEICLDREVSPEKHRSPKLFDLNVPHVSPDVAADEALMTGIVQEGDNSSINTSSFVLETSQQHEEIKVPDSSSPVQPIMNIRRQSTRNRPLTTKALEALELGFLTTTKKRKSFNSPGSNSMSRTSRRVRGRTSVKTSFSDGSGSNAVESGAEKFLDGFHNNIDLISQSRD